MISELANPVAVILPVSQGWSCALTGEVLDLSPAAIVLEHAGPLDFDLYREATVRIGFQNSQRSITFRCAALATEPGEAGYVSTFVYTDAESPDRMKDRDVLFDYLMTEVWPRHISRLMQSGRTTLFSGQDDPPASDAHHPDLAD